MASSKLLRRPSLKQIFQASKDAAVIITGIIPILLSLPIAMVASDSLQLQTVEAIAKTKEAPDYIRTNIKKTHILKDTRWKFFT